MPPLNTAVIVAFLATGAHAQSIMDAYHDFFNCQRASSDVEVMMTRTLPITEPACGARKTHNHHLPKKSLA